MLRNEHPVCAGCGKSFDTSIARRAKNILLRLFVSVRSSKHLQPQDQVCKQRYAKFLVYFKKGRGIYDDIPNNHLSVENTEDDENDE